MWLPCVWVKICQINNPHINCETTSRFLSKFCIILHFHGIWHSSVNFKLIHFLLLIKGSYESQNFETFKCFSEKMPNSSCHFPNHKSVFLQILHQSLVSCKMYYLHKRNQSKCNFLRRLSAGIKVCQIPHVNFETTSQILFKFFIIFQCHYT